MNDIAIRVENLGKKYRIGRAQQQHDTLRDALAASLHGQAQRLSSVVRHPSSEGGSPASGDDQIWALKDVSFEIRRGEVVGIIGRNGAGKSTLLKILSRITEPTEGRAEIHGRVGSLLEVGTGFHPELTGRDNIYLSGAILGMRKAEIDRRFDEIVAFSEVEKFIDTPIKRYSSGMNVRLGFAVAAHLDPEVLLVDEVLAVGDASFQKKCLGKIGEVALGGRTVLFVSHNMTAILNLCGRAVLLDAGHIACEGVAADVAEQYLTRTRRYNTFLPELGIHVGGERARIEAFEVDPPNPRTGMPVEFTFTISRAMDASSTLWCEMAVAVLTHHGTRLFQVYSRHMDHSIPAAAGTTRVSAIIDRLPLAPGEYKVNLWLGAGDTPVHWIRDCFDLLVEPGRLTEGQVADNRGYPVILPSRWIVHEGEKNSQFGG